MGKQYSLWYRRPASQWVEALPLGNGRIGAMAFSGIAEERLALNEDTLWSGYPKDTDNPAAHRYFREAQRLIAQGLYEEAQRFAEEHLTSEFSQSYLPLGDMLISFDGCGDEPRCYRRALTLNDAVCRASFRIGDTRYSRETFVSCPRGALYYRAASDRPGGVSFTLRLASKLRHETCAENDGIRLWGVAPDEVRPVYIDDPEPVRYAEDDAHKGMRFEMLASVETQGGAQTCDGGTIRVENADWAVIRLTARTSFAGFDRHPFTQGLDEHALCLDDMARAKEVSFDEARGEHAADHAALFDRVEIDLRGDEHAQKPTDERLQDYSPINGDRNLVETIFQYGRYLLIASSRPGTQPTNLQGIWNEHLQAPWSSNYTVNINTEMNYWPAEICNLSELHEPLFGMVRDLMTTGAKTAEAHYGARGAVAHHNVDLWRMSNPVGVNRPDCAQYAYWPMSFGWLCRHLYDHYLFTGDKAFLREEALPALRAAARFYLDTCVCDGNGYVYLSPMTSPENSFMVNGKKQSLAKAATMSNAIFREVLENYLGALRTLDIDEDMRTEAELALPHIYPYEVGEDGRLKEYAHDFPDYEPKHRHISHLYGLYPGAQITPEGTPELAQACRRTLAVRGDDGTGWSLGWKINVWARLGDGSHALKLVNRQLRFVEEGGYNYQNGGGTYMNLFDAHPPFQIDGNFGAASGIAEMFVQSREGEVILLPALPKEWPDGCVRGLCAMGGVEVDVSFRAGRLYKAVIRRIRDCDGPVTVRYENTTRTVCPNPGEDVMLTFD